MANAKGERQEPATPLARRLPTYTAAMGVLHGKAGNGYDITRRINRILGPSWNFEPKQIYGVLKALIGDGLVQVDENKVYHLTEQGEYAWAEWLSTPMALAPIREHIQVRLAFSNEEDAQKLLVRFQDYRTELLRQKAENAVGGSELEFGQLTTWGGLTLSLARDGVDEDLKAKLAWVEKVCREVERWVAGRRSRR